MPIRFDFPGRCEAIEYWWIDRQIYPLTSYQVGQIDNLNAKITEAIVNGTPEEQEALYRRLGDFEAALNLLR